MIETITDLVQSSAGWGQSLLKWLWLSLGGLIGVSEQVSKRGIEDKCVANSFMVIDSSYHIYREVSSFVDDSEKSDVDRLLHVTSAFQFLYDLILAHVGWGYKCEFQVDFGKIFDDFQGLFEVKDYCSNDKLFMIAQF